MTVKRSLGFTLVEVLVVLVIAALVSALLFQALAQIYRLQGRFGEQLSLSQGGAMRADWYRQLLQGLSADFKDGKEKFSGQPDQLQGLTLTAPGVSAGGPRWVTLTIAPSTTAAQGGTVRLRAGDTEVVLFEWTTRGRAEFAYLDDDGAETPQWPPLVGANIRLGPEKPPLPQLPAAVLLKLPASEGRQVFVAVPRGGRDDRIRPFVMEATP